MSEPRFEWAKGKVLTPSDFEIDDKIAFVEDFVFSASITLIYSPAKQGKTWLGYGVAMEISKHEECEEVYYLDMDNSVSTLKERNVHNVMLPNKKLYYITRSTIGCEPIEQLQSIANGAFKDNYKNIVFFLDTTKDFVDTDNKTQSVQFMKYCVALRDAGATVIVMHHATKNKRQISGNQVFTNTPDNVFEMKQSSKFGTTINYELKVTHARGLVKDCRWSVDTTSLELLSYDAVSTGLSSDEKDKALKAIEALKNSTEGLSMSSMVLAMGFENRSDRKGKKIVNELCGVYWIKEELTRNRHIYKLKKGDK